MTARTVEWPVIGPEDGGRTSEGLRERKKRRLRQALSDTATEMFLERGFDAVRVADVAEACEVSEATVYNYFPSKEALVLDRLETMMASLRAGLIVPGVPLVEAALQILEAELGALAAWHAAHDDPLAAARTSQRFLAMVDSTPALRAYESDMMDKLIDVAAEQIAEQAGMSRDGPEPQIAATALLGLWRIQSQALRRHLDRTRAPAQLKRAVTKEVRRAAALVDGGLRSFAPLEP